VTTTSYNWRFFRAGGFDQVRLDRAADLLALGQLDQKLWVALSCPTTGIEFDLRTLALIDSDGDGHIRAGELIAAVNWAAARLADREVLAQSLPGLPVTALADTEEGAALGAAAGELLTELGLPADGLLTVAEAAAAEARCQARLQAAWAAAEPALPGIEDAAAAYAAYGAVKAKIDDYFARCRLAAFDSRAAEALNPDGDTLRALGNGLLHGGAEAIAALPLARIEAQRALPLRDGLNPAWTGPMAAFVELVARPLLGAASRNELTESQWTALEEKLAAYQSWRAADPAQAAEPAPALLAARDLERLARYVRDLLPLANNFVAFRDFYTRQAKATFQVGTLYLDGRSAELCIAVSDGAKHAALASLSRICLVYCDCRRKSTGDNGGPEKMTIAAAFTAGDSDQLLVGRNGVFYDRQGRDWDATITRIIDHPISLRQAFWSPYKRLARLVAEQLHKIAANKAAGVEAQLAQTAAGMGKKLEAPGAKPAAQQAFDVGKFAGIFAAIGLAVGALGTAVASLVTGLLGLAWWQVPLALAGLLLAVSGPAMIVAAFKLRGRNLGPLLDANGWAINARARINIPFGTSLTGLAQLPPGAERALTDPYADKPFPWGRVLFAAAVLGAAAVTWWTLIP